jgi:hypothetical protein
LKSIGFQRTALEINDDELPLLGNVTHETSQEALRGILRSGLRSDYNKHGGRGMGRSAITTDAFDLGDHVSNRFQQRTQGQARVVINEDRWRKDIGEKVTDPVGVVLSFTGAGAVTFSNTVYNMATIIPVEYFEAAYVHSRWEKEALKNVKVARSDHVAKCGGHASLTDDIDLAKEYNLNGRRLLMEIANNLFIATDEVVVSNEHGVPLRISYEHISALPTIQYVEAGIVLESRPKWTRDAELFNLEQVQARLRVCGNDVEEANSRCRKDLVSESKGETYYF